MLDLPHSREYFAALFDAAGSRPVPAFRSSQPEVVRGMVANGLGSMRVVPSVIGV